MRIFYICYIQIDIAEESDIQNRNILEVMHSTALTRE